MPEPERSISSTPRLLMTMMTARAASPRITGRAREESAERVWEETMRRAPFSKISGRKPD